MQKEIALAYAVAGLAVAIAIVTAFGSTTGLLTSRPQRDADRQAQDSLDAQSCQPAPSAIPEPAAQGPTRPTEVELEPAPRAVLHAASASSLEGVRLAATNDGIGQGDVEIVYVDEPAPPRRRRDDNDDDDDSDEEDSDHKDKQEESGEDAERKREGGGKRRAREGGDDE